MWDMLGILLLIRRYQPVHGCSPNQSPIHPSSGLGLWEMTEVVACGVVEHSEDDTCAGGAVLVEG